MNKPDISGLGDNSNKDALVTISLLNKLTFLRKSSFYQVLQFKKIFLITSSCN